MTKNNDEDLLHGDLTRTVIGGAYAIHTQLGEGFLEHVYSNGLSAVLRGAGIAVRREAPYEIFYRGETLGRYKADLVVDDKVVIEVKAGKAIDQSARAQLYNYLRVSGLQVGLIINFSARVDFKRVICTSHRVGIAIASRSA